MRAVAFAACVAAATAAAPKKTISRPVFPASWTAHETVTFYAPNATTPEDTITAWSFWQQDSVANRTCNSQDRSDDAEKYVNLFDGDSPAEYYVFGGQCQYYCPIDPEDTPCDSEDSEDSLCTYDYLHGAIPIGNSSVNGIPVEGWFWTSGIGPIIMATETLWSVPGQAIPVQTVHTYSPFGVAVGTEFNLFQNFSAGAPTPSTVFDIPGQEYCEQGDSSDCPDSDAIRKALTAAAAKPGVAEEGRGKAMWDELVRMARARSRDTSGAFPGLQVRSLLRLLMRKSLPARR